MTTASTARSNRSQASGINSGSRCSGIFAMAFSGDDWVSEHSIIDPERAHALEVVGLAWNMCERNLLLIFCTMFKLKSPISWIVSNDIGDIALSGKIVALIDAMTTNTDEAICLRNYLSVYDVCRQNRNLLCHGMPSTDKGALEPRDAFLLKMKGHKLNPIPIPSSLGDIRRMAFELRYLTMVSWNIYEALVKRRRGVHSALPLPMPLPELLVKPPQQSSPQSTRRQKLPRWGLRKKKS